MNKNFGYIGATELTVKKRLAKHRYNAENGGTTTLHKHMRGHTTNTEIIRSGLQYHDAVRLETEFIKTHGSLNDNTVSTGLVKKEGNLYTVYHINKFTKK